VLLTAGLIPVHVYKKKKACARVRQQTVKSSAASITPLSDPNTLFSVL